MIIDSDYLLLSALVSKGKRKKARVEPSDAESSDAGEESEEAMSVEDNFEDLDARIEEAPTAQDSDEEILAEPGPESESEEEIPPIQRTPMVVKTPVSTVSASGKS